MVTGHRLRVRAIVYRVTLSGLLKTNVTSLSLPGHIEFCHDARKLPVLTWQEVFPDSFQQNMEPPDESDAILSANTSSGVSAPVTLAIVLSTIAVIALIRGLSWLLEFMVSQTVFPCKLSHIDSHTKTLLG